VATPVRPPLHPHLQVQAQAPGLQSARSAAQRAFFEAAAGRATATAEPAAPAAHVQKVPTALPADPPERVLRPGSLLDIKV
jgi:hypothetical protein